MNNKLQLPEVGELYKIKKRTVFISIGKFHYLDKDDIVLLLSFKEFSYNKDLFIFLVGNKQRYCIFLNKKDFNQHFSLYEN